MKVNKAKGNIKSKKGAKTWSAKKFDKAKKKHFGV